ncbi:DUF6797 domain-containing protein [Humisphaera borealis]|uniref:C-type cytochrome n=1 Tax=Humisphaera borealis TaxID=2807512 RepID=A0A7M2X0E5_9BACT|nr:DUF6797 domain-containing protein [Humisphaera borealis]QOV91236.1 c-type cytochrome [Humisphaera borealis]
MVASFRAVASGISTLLLICGVTVGQVVLPPARTVQETQEPVFAGFAAQPQEQILEHPRPVANFRLHLEYRLPGPTAALEVRTGPAPALVLPSGDAGAWRVLELQFEHLPDQAASLLAEVDGKIISDIPVIPDSKKPRGKGKGNSEAQIPGGIAGVPARLSIVTRGNAEIRQAWLQPLGDTPHASLIASWNEESLKRGKEVFTSLCATCHGSPTVEGSMPTSRKFHAEPFKNGTDPYRLFQTITSGYGQMVPLPVPPEDRYAAMQYLREEVLKPLNPTQHFAVDAAYLASLPRAMRTLPKQAPTDRTPFYAKMDFGPVLNWTYQVTKDNIANKGIAVRVDAGPGGIARGRAWMLYDHDTMRMAAAWTGEGFIDWKGIAFDGSHQTHSSIVGKVIGSTPEGPGWANPTTGDWTDPRPPMRDGRRYGPLPRSWTQLRGVYLHGDQAVVSYTVGEVSVLDKPGLVDARGRQAFTRTLNVGSCDRPMALRIAAVEPGLNLALRGQGGSIAERDGFHVLTLPPSTSPRLLKVYFGRMANASIAPLAAADETPLDLANFVHGGPARWALTLNTQATIGTPDGAFAVDTLTLPDINPWNSFLRVGGFDFLPGGKRAAMCTWNGDVWTVDGLSEKPSNLKWRRIATGLFQPLGLKVVNGDIYLCCRDQIAILRDLNGDGETDFVQCFNNDHQVTPHFHEFAMGLQVDDAGNFYYAKSARHALPAVVPQHGTLLRVSPDGGRTDIIATGFRAANGVCLNPDGTFFVTDQEGHWTPKNRINHVVPDGGFFGNMFSGAGFTDPSDSAMRQPLCWITNAKDRSPAELLWVPRGTWGPLAGSLLNTSYGYGRVYVVPHETINGQMQGGVVELPIDDFPAGIVRARFHPTEGQLYACGLTAWATNCKTPGGFYRMRYTGQAANLPVSIRAVAEGMAVTFTEPINDKSAGDASRFQLKTWHLERSQKYGSAHLDEKPSKIVRTRLLDEKTVLIEIDGFAPTQCYELRYELIDTNGKTFTGSVHGTIHALGAKAPAP